MFNLVSCSWPFTALVKGWLRETKLAHIQLEEKALHPLSAMQRNNVLCSPMSQDTGLHRYKPEGALKAR